MGNAVEVRAAKSPRLAGTLLQAGERWSVDWHDPSVDVDAWLDFSRGVDGVALRMAKVDPDADFSFDFEDSPSCGSVTVRDLAAPSAAVGRHRGGERRGWEHNRWKRRSMRLMTEYRGDVPGACVLVVRRRQRCGTHRLRTGGSGSEGRHDAGNQFSPRIRHQAVHGRSHSAPRGGRPTRRSSIPCASGCHLSRIAPIR